MGRTPDEILLPVALLLIGGVFSYNFLRSRPGEEPAAYSPKASPVTTPPPPADYAWPTLQGNPARTGRAPGPLPEKLTLRWSRAIGDGARAAPVVGGERLLAASDEGRVVCLDLDTGEEHWRYKLPDRVGAGLTARADTLYIGDEGGGFHALDIATGEARWRFRAEQSITGAALVVDDRVVFGSHDHRLYCLAAADGRKLWRVETDSYIHAAPALAEETLYLAGCDGYLRALSLADGSERAAAYIEGNLAAAPGLGANRIVLGTMSGRLVALERSRLSLAWDTGKRYDANWYASAALTEDRAVFASRTGLVAALALDDGRELWRAGGGSDAAPLIAGERVYLAGSDGFLRARSLHNGAELWRYELGEPVAAAAAAGGGRLVVVTQLGTLFCFGAASQRTESATSSSTGDATP